MAGGLYPWAMIAAPGLQVGFGDPLDPATLQELRQLGFTIIRLDLQKNSQAQTAALAQEVLDAGLQPLCIIRRSEQIEVLPEGALIELGNEPDLEHEGWTVAEYIREAEACIALALQHKRRLYLGAVSNLNVRGINFLRQLPWANWTGDGICCSIHRYPETDGTPETPHTGWQSRADEVNSLRAVVGPRPLACTEVGYDDSPSGWTESEVALNMRWERDFFGQQGFEICVGYQINDGPGSEPIDHYGFRYRDGSWKPVAYFFINAELPTVPGVTTSLGTTNGYFLCAENGGGSYVACDRPEAGPWEQWTVHTHEDGRVSLQSENGFFVCAELDGTVNANRAHVGDWEKFEIEVRDDLIVSFKTAHGSYLQAPQGGGANTRLVHVQTVPGEWEFFAASHKFWKPDVPVCARPLIGPLRVEAKLFRDDSGFRRVFFCSWFAALRILRDDPNEFYRQLNSIVEAGYQGIRVFLTVGGWMEFWDDREVVPKQFQKWYWTGNFLRTDRFGTLMHAWPEYDDLLRLLLQECRKRKLRLHVTTGDMQIISANPNDEIDLARRFARICAEEGGTDVVALVEVTNEFPINRFASEAPMSITQMGRVIDVWTEAIPGVLTAQGAILSEEPDQLEKSATYGNVCAVHTTRDPFEMCLKRTFGLVYWEGDYRAFKFPFWQGEPAGPGEESFARQDSPPNLVALYALHALTGQASNRFQGAAVRSFQQLESEWGFWELPALFDILLPEDIALWEHGSNQRGGIEYYWKGKDFRTVVYTDWDPSPPFPIAQWTLYTGVDVIHGTGAPYRATRYKGGPRGTGLLVGKFA